MFNGGIEIGFLLFIAFLLFGPKKLPEIARVLGKGLGELRRASNELRFSLEEEIRNLDHEATGQPNGSSKASSGDDHPLFSLRNTLEEEIRKLDLESGSEPGELGKTYGHNHSEATAAEPKTQP